MEVRMCVCVCVCVPQRYVVMTVLIMLNFGVFFFLLGWFFSYRRERDASDAAAIFVAPVGRRQWGWGWRGAERRGAKREEPGE